MLLSCIVVLAFTLLLHRPAARGTAALPVLAVLWAVLCGLTMLLQAGGAGGAGGGGRGRSRGGGRPGRARMLHCCCVGTVGGCGKGGGDCSVKRHGAELWGWALVRAAACCGSTGPLREYAAHGPTPLLFVSPPPAVPAPARPQMELPPPRLSREKLRLFPDSKLQVPGPDLLRL